MARVPRRSAGLLVHRTGADGEVVQAGGTRVVAWAVAGDVDVSALRPGTFEMEWPPRSGARERFFEIDRAAWFPLAAAPDALLPGQHPFLDRTAAALRGHDR